MQGLVTCGLFYWLEVTRFEKGGESGVDRQTDRQTDRQRHREIDRDTEREIDKEKDRQTDRQRSILFGAVLCFRADWLRSSRLRF